ncbi:MAG: creatininase family protein [Ruminococcaceae bacterium]|nr:creatininase family protein [Oscillospiraceae bacterium]
METRWLYTTSENFHALREASNDTCIIPMGCVEKHGLHLPLGTDIIAAGTLAYAASQIETVCVFPDFIFGDVPDNSPNAPAGTVTLSLETEMLLLEELCEQIARHGYKKILVLNGHGGNSHWLAAFSRKLATKKRSFVFAVTELDLFAPHDMAEAILKEGPEVFPELTKEDIDLLLKYHEERLVVGHACLSETSLVMAVAPDSVHLDRLGIESGLSLHKADYLAKAGIHIKDNGWGVNYPNAYTGGDHECNERIAKATFRFSAEKFAERFKVFKEDTNVLEWLEEAQKGW